MIHTREARRALVAQVASHTLIAILAALALAWIVAHTAGCSAPSEGSGLALPRIALGEAGGRGYATVYVDTQRLRFETDQRTIVLGDERVYCPTVRIEIGALVIQGAQPGADERCVDAFGAVEGAPAGDPAPFSGGAAAVVDTPLGSP